MLLENLCVAKVAYDTGFYENCAEVLSSMIESSVEIEPEFLELFRKSFRRRFEANKKAILLLQDKEKGKLKEIYREALRICTRRIQKQQIELHKQFVALSNKVIELVDDERDTVPLLKEIADACSYVDGILTGEMKTETVNYAETCYAKALKISETNFGELSYEYLSCVLNWSVFGYRNRRVGPIMLAKEVYAKSIPSMQRLIADGQQDVVRLMQLMNRNLVSWN